MNIDFFNYRLSIELNLRPTKKALARVAFLDTFLLVISTLGLAFVSAYICQHLALVLLISTFLAIASVQVNESILDVNLSMRN